MIDTDAMRKEWKKWTGFVGATIHDLCDEIDPLRERDELAQKVLEAATESHAHHYNRNTCQPTCDALAAYREASQVKEGE